MPALTSAVEGAQHIFCISPFFFFFLSSFSFVSEDWRVTFILDCFHRACRLESSDVLSLCMGGL